MPESALHRLFRAASIPFLTAIAALLLAIPVLRLWEADLRVPFAYSGDVNFNLMLIKGIIDHGWYNENPSLGAPFGQQLYDFPHNTDNLNFALIKLLSLVSSDPAIVMNMFFLLGFPLIAAISFLVLRSFGITNITAAAASILFTFLPYRFMRGEQHLFVGTYYAVPIGAFLVLGVLSGKTLLARRGDRRNLTAFATRRTAMTVLMCVVVASAGVYYAIFTVVLAAAASLVAAVAHRTRAPIVAATVVSGLVGTTLLVNAAPALAYRLEHGPNHEPIKRHRSETETFALRLPELLLPIDDHRFEPFARAKRRYTTLTSLSDRQEAFQQSLGLVASVGFFASVLVFFAAAFAPVRARLQLVRDTGAATIIAVLVGITGGFATFIAFFVTPVAHAWGRIAIVIGFFALLTIAVLLDEVRARVARGRHAAFALVAAVLVAVGVLDQTSNEFIPAYADVRLEYESEAEFVRVLESELQPGAGVFQLPYLAFPVGGSKRRMLDYDHLKGYFHSHELRWTYGAMRGRPEDWSAELADQPPELVAAAVAGGFAGIYVDRFAYTDSATRLESRLERLLRVSPLVSSTSRLSFFDLRPFRERLQRQHSLRIVQDVFATVTEPVRVEWPGGPWGRERDDAHSWRWLTTPSAELSLVNPWQEPRRVEINFRAEPPPGRSSELRISYPDGFVRMVRLPPAGVRVRRAVTLGTGRSALTLSVRGGPGSAPGDPRPLYARIIDTRVVDTKLATMARLTLRDDE